MKLLKPLLYLIIGLTFLYNIKSFLNFNFNSLEGIISQISPSFLLLSIFCYFFSHVLRTFRLYTLANDVSISFINFISLQFKANSLNLIFPFKLGEFYRIFSFSKILGGNIKSTTTLLIERIFDFLVLFIILSFGVLISDSIRVSDISYIYFPVLLVSILLISFITLSYDSIILFQKRIIQRYKGVRSTRILKISTEIISILDYSNKLVSKQIFKISLLTFLIWGLEISSTIYLTTFFGFEIDILILLGVYIAFSSLLPNGPLGIGGLQLSFYYLFDSFDLNLDYGSVSHTYILFIFGSGLLIGGLLFSFDLLKKIFKL